MESNGTEPRQTPPIKYPTIPIPGKGTYIVKFGLGAAYTLETDFGIDPAQFAEQIRQWAPHTDEVTGQVFPGKASPSLLFKILSACIADQVSLTPRQIADAFNDFTELGKVAEVLVEAFSKIPRSEKIKLQEPAATQEPAKLQ